MDLNTMVAVASICIDKTGGIDIRSETDPDRPEANLLILGALEVAKDMIKKKIDDDYANTGLITTAGNRGSQQYVASEKKKKMVSKQEAIDHYLALVGKIGKRIEVSKASDDRASFEINPSLLDDI